ncbi:MAG: hypothetical protein HQM00_09135 [Magnetococcales bacterium]|nr:hypothetical protein [Magnetococcales bacterium]
MDKSTLLTLAAAIRNHAIADPFTALAEQGVQLRILSPLQPVADPKELETVIRPFVQILQHQNALPGQQPSMAPGEVKSAEVWVEEFSKKPEARCAVILFEAGSGRCMSGAIGPTLIGETDHLSWAFNVLEYGGSALHDFGRGTGLGTLVAALYRHEAERIARHLNRTFLGVLIESVTTAGKFWNSIGAKGLFRRRLREGAWILEALSYAMPQLPGEEGLHPETGIPPEGEPDYWRERITLVPGQAGQRHLSGRLYKAMITAFHEGSMRPQRADFNSDQAHAAALGYFLRTLHEVCLDHVEEGEVIELYADEEILASGLSAFVWRKEEAEHRLGRDRAGATGELMPYL